MRHRQVARLLEHEVDALPRGLLAHVVGRGVAARVDDLVLAVLVAVRARQVALVGDVQDHRREREVGLREDAGEGLLRGAGEADRADPHQLGEAAADGGFAVEGGKRGDDGVFAGRTVVEGLQNGERSRIEVEDGGGGDQVEEGFAAGFEGVELALGEEGGVGGGGVGGGGRGVAWGRGRAGGGGGSAHQMTVGECGVKGQSAHQRGDGGGHMVD